MGFMPPAWTPKRTGNSLPKRDETRASAHDAWAGPCWMWPTTSEDSCHWREENVSMSRRGLASGRILALRLCAPCTELYS